MSSSRCWPSPRRALARRPPAGRRFPPPGTRRASPGNLNKAAQNIIIAKPLTGVGWGNFVNKSADYFEQAETRPLSATHLEVHNLFLGYAANLGLIGFGLWALALIAGIGGALAQRPPPQLRYWHTGLLANAIFFVVVMNFVPPQVFPNLLLWLWAGVVWSGRYVPERA